MGTLLSKNFKVSQVQMYDKSKEFIEHLINFKAHMTLHDFHEEIVYKAFSLTLKGTDWSWFKVL